MLCVYCEFIVAPDTSSYCVNSQLIVLQVSVGRHHTSLYHVHTLQTSIKKKKTCIAHLFHTYMRTYIHTYIHTYTYISQTQTKKKKNTVFVLKKMGRTHATMPCALMSQIRTVYSIHTNNISLFGVLETPRSSRHAVRAKISEGNKVRIDRSRSTQFRDHVLTPLEFVNIM